MDSSKESKPELPVSNEARVELVQTFFNSTAFQIAEERFKARLFDAWLSSSPHSYEDRETLYTMAKGFDGMKLELQKILENANTELAKSENLRRQRDMDSRREQY